MGKAAGGPLMRALTGVFETMPNSILVKPDGSEHTIAVENRTTVMEAGRDANLGM